MSYTFIILGINELKEHEEIIEDLLEALAEEIKKDGVLKKPILVDKASMVILDGHHRLHALRLMGYEKVSVFLLDYTSSLEIEKWYRVIEGNPSPNIIEKIREKGIRVEKIEEDAKIKETFEKYANLLKGYDKMIEEKNALGILIHIDERASYLLFSNNEKEDIKQKYSELARIEDVFREKGYPVDYNNMENTVKNMMACRYHWILLGPKVERSDVIDMGLSEEIFAPKTTRHIVKTTLEDREVKLEDLL
ncbi:MAG: ParB N-terminal domain-containing protein [Thermoplasmata archaeon]